MECDICGHKWCGQKWEDVSQEICPSCGQTYCYVEDVVISLHPWQIELIRCALKSRVESLPLQYTETDK